MARKEDLDALKADQGAEISKLMVTMSILSDRLAKVEDATGVDEDDG